MYVKKLVPCIGVIVLSWLLCLLFCVGTATCLVGLDRTMSWYARPIWVFFLYVIPTLVVSLATILLHAKYYNKVRAIIIIVKYSFLMTIVNFRI